MSRTRILAAGLTMLAGSFAATASAQECQKHFLWMCVGGGTDGSAAEAAPAGRPLRLDAVARSGAGRHHTVSRRHGHRFARHHFFHHSSPHVLALGADPAASPSAASPPADRIPSERIVLAMSVPGMNWADERADEAGSVAAALMAPQTGGVDFLTEWQHTVGPITANIWPEQTLNSFTDFPPL